MLVHSRTTSPHDAVREFNTGRGRQSPRRGRGLEHCAATLSRIPSWAVYCTSATEIERGAASGLRLNLVRRKAGRGRQSPHRGRGLGLVAATLVRIWSGAFRRPRGKTGRGCQSPLRGRGLKLGTAITRIHLGGPLAHSLAQAIHRLRVSPWTPSNYRPTPAAFLGEIHRRHPIQAWCAGDHFLFQPRAEAGSRPRSAAEPPAVWGRSGRGRVAPGAP